MTGSKKAGSGTYGGRVARWEMNYNVRNVEEEKSLEDCKDVNLELSKWM